MKNATALVIAAVVIAVASLAASPLRAAGKPEVNIKFVSVSDGLQLRTLSSQGWIVRAATVCADSSGAVASAVPSCLVLQHL